MTSLHIVEKIMSQNFKYVQWSIQAFTMLGVLSGRKPTLMWRVTCWCSRLPSTGLPQHQRPSVCSITSNEKKIRLPISELWIFGWDLGNTWCKAHSKDLIHYATVPFWACQVHKVKSSRAEVDHRITLPLQPPHWTAIVNYKDQHQGKRKNRKLHCHGCKLFQRNES